jgi:hypothetical protein
VRVLIDECLNWRLGRALSGHYIFWLRDESLEDSTNLPDPDVIAAAVTQPQARPGFQIVEDLEAALQHLLQSRLT